MRYFVTPNYSLAFIPKSGCSTLSRAVIDSFQPEENALIENGAYPEGKNADNCMWQWLAKVEMQPTKPILAFIREPLERFRSAMAQFRLTDVPAALESLTAGTHLQLSRRTIDLSTNPHFLPQIKWVDANTKLYKFPEHLTEGAQELGMILPLPVINAASNPKPTLTPEQEAAVLQYYQEDTLLFNSITTAGIVSGIVEGVSLQQN